MKEKTIDNVTRISKYGLQDWMTRAPKFDNGERDSTKPLGLAVGNFYALEKLHTELVGELSGATAKYTKKALPTELRRIAAAYSAKLDQHKLPAKQIQRKADSLLASMAPKKREGDGAERAIREAEIRALLASNLPPEASLAVVGNDGESRWIVEQYEQAVTDGDTLMADAIENAPSVFPAAMRLTKDELTELRTRRAEVEHPEKAQALGDYRAALADLKDVAGEIEQNIAEVRRQNPKPDAKPDDPVARLAAGDAA